MKLIYAKGACSMATHILMEELELDYQALEVSLIDKTALYQYNPKGYVPALVLEDGQVLTESISLLLYLADTHPGSKLIAEIGSIERARCIEWLTFISTEIHKGFSPLFKKDLLTSEFKDFIVNKVENRLAFMDQHLDGKIFLVGEGLTIADMYAIAILRIAEHLNFSFDKFINLRRYKKMMEQDIPSVQSVIQIEENAANSSWQQSRYKTFEPIEILN